MLDPKAAALADATRLGDQLLGRLSEIPRASVVARVYEHYRQMAAIWPDEPIAHLRLAGIITHIMAVCTPTCATAEDRALALEALTHWQAYFDLAPGDERTFAATFQRAILRTKVGGDQLALAAQDYRKLIALGDLGAYLGSPSVLHLNLAEVLMMDSSLDASIDEYRVAVSLSREPSSAYGLAVALDRAGYVDEARDVIRGLGKSALEEYKVSIDRGDTFYVPEGEVFYYYGVALDALGHGDLARIAFTTFVESGANPQFAPQARAHITRLTRAAR
ncbi:MAG: hypothetical protein IPL79_01130 [Myxococcales bacterium]|nr:hypothetical protein [Myxococcales bacterium]